MKIPLSISEQCLQSNRERLPCFPFNIVLFILLQGYHRLWISQIRPETSQAGIPTRIPRLGNLSSQEKACSMIVYPDTLGIGPLIFPFSFTSQAEFTVSSS